MSVQVPYQRTTRPVSFRWAARAPGTSGILPSRRYETDTRYGTRTPRGSTFPRRRGCDADRRGGGVPPRPSPAPDPERRRGTGGTGGWHSPGNRRGRRSRPSAGSTRPGSGTDPRWPATPPRTGGDRRCRWPCRTASRPGPHRRAPARSGPCATGMSPRDRAASRRPGRPGLPGRRDPSPRAVARGRRGGPPTASPDASRMPRATCPCTRTSGR